MRWAQYFKPQSWLNGCPLNTWGKRYPMQAAAKNASSDRVKREVVREIERVLKPSRPPPPSRPHPRRFDREPEGPRSQVQLELGHLHAVKGQGVGAHASHAITDAAAQGAQALPFQAVERVGIRLPLGDEDPRQTATGELVMAGRAGEI